MSKGFFSQCVCLLTDGSTTIADIRAAVQAAGFDIAKELPASEHWEFGGPSLVVSYRPEVNGGVVVDLVGRPWPDGMGDPKTAPFLFAAWGMGHFGPFAFPGGLKRAAEHAWGWQPGREAAAKHKGVIRLRMSYVGGLPEDAPVLPRDCDPVAELAFLTRLAIAAGSTAGTLCYFNPNGEVLRDINSLRSVFLACVQQQKHPILLWANARLFKLDARFGFMDTVGNEQLDVSDVEVVYPTARYKPADIDYYMRNVTHYLLESGRELRRGEAIDGPGEQGLSWTIDVPERPLVSPPRRVLRLFPKVDAPAVRRVLKAAGSQ